MKKFTKEQLENTYIEFDSTEDEIFKCYIAACKSEGVTARKHILETKSKSVGYIYPSEHRVWQNLHPETKKYCNRLHLSDLIELENSKVYTTDADVVRKYAEVCGKTVHDNFDWEGYIGCCSWDDMDEIDSFEKHHSAHDEYHNEITVDQVNAMHREKFPEQHEANKSNGENIKVDPSVYEEGMRNAMKRIARAVGKEFGVDIGYEDLPELVESMVKKPQPKPRTRVEYVKIEFEHAWEAVKAFEEGEKLYTNVSNDTYSRLDVAPDVLKYLYRLHRRVEKEIDWRDELRASLGEGFGIHNSEHSVGFVGFDGLYTKSNAVKLAKAILRATGELPE